MDRSSGDGDLHAGQEFPPREDNGILERHTAGSGETQDGQVGRAGHGAGIERAGVARGDDVKRYWLLPRRKMPSQRMPSVRRMVPVVEDKEREPQEVRLHADDSPFRRSVGIFGVSARSADPEKSDTPDMRHEVYVARRDSPIAQVVEGYEEL